MLGIKPPDPPLEPLHRLFWDAPMGSLHSLHVTSFHSRNGSAMGGIIRKPLGWFFGNMAGLVSLSGMRMADVLGLSLGLGACRPFGYFYRGHLGFFELSC